MLAVPRIHRLVFVCLLACALLVSATSVAAAAGSDDSTSAALAQERYYSSYGEPDPATIAAALAQERYYMSFGEPAALTLPQAPAPAPAPAPADDAPWLPITAAILAGLALVASVTRLRSRRRAAGATA